MIILNVVITRYFSFQNHKNQTCLSDCSLPLFQLSFADSFMASMPLCTDFLPIHVRCVGHHFSYSLENTRKCLAPSPQPITPAWKRCLACVRSDMLKGPHPDTTVVLALTLAGNVTLASYFTNLGYINSSVWTRSLFSKI